MDEVEFDRLKKELKRCYGNLKALQQPIGGTIYIRNQENIARKQDVLLEEIKRIKQQINEL